MISIHAMDAPLPRLVAESLGERLRAMSAVVVTGARQTGKSTLVQDLALGARRYASLDDLDVFNAGPPRSGDSDRRGASPDARQREPEVLRAVKRATARRHTPGRSLLTGSVQPALLSTRAMDRRSYGMCSSPSTSHGLRRRQMRAMRVVVDYTLCEANARCMEAAPEVFCVEEDDTLTVLIEEPPDALAKQVELAARLCPRQAITLE
jgi:ferredoxin